MIEVAREKLFNCVEDQVAFDYVFGCGTNGLTIYVSDIVRTREPATSGSRVPGTLRSPLGLRGSVLPSGNEVVPLGSSHLRCHFIRETSVKVSEQSTARIEIRSTARHSRVVVRTDATNCGLTHACMYNSLLPDLKHS